MAAGTNFDRRDSVRVEVHLSVEVVEARSTIHMTVASDLSEGGMFIHELLPFEIGTNLVLDFQLPGEERKVHCSAEVAHKRDHFLEGMPNRPIGNGLRFLTLSKADRDLVLRYMRDRADEA